MKSRRVFLAVTAALALLAAWMTFHHGQMPPIQTPAEYGNHTPTTLTTSFVAQPIVTSPPTASTVADGGGPHVRAAMINGHQSRATPRVSAAAIASPTPLNPQSEVEKVHHMITNYHTLMGENPVGTNAEIMRELMGANPHQAILGPPEGQTLNGKGELIDPWGTPYFFHQLSRDVMEIHSAGPDKVMGTADDVVTR